MKSISIDEIKPGMAFSRDVFIEEDSLLAPAKMPIKERDLDRARGWGITEVQTDGVEYRADSEVKSSVSGNGHGPDTEKIRSHYNTTVINLLTLFTAFEAKKKTEGKSYTNLLDVVFPLILKDPEAWLNYALEAKRDVNNPAQNAVNTMIYCMAIAEKTTFSDKEKLDLAMAALLHDIGMLKIPDSIKRKNGKLTNDELVKMKTHTILTYRFITSELGFEDALGRIALLHHERWDGKGYPRQLAKKQIPLAARILSVADAFEAMIKDTPYRDSMIGYTAVRQILNDNSRRFDADIIKVFIKSMGIYPVGSYVILNDGAVGVVSKIHANAPLRPVIRVLMTGKGEKVQNMNVNLLEHSESFIARPFNPKEIKKKG
ncbi:MAG: HD-GYP domain-containing protein [Spirochaetales bacterium]|nr:HD-GYP domain-containing protein [Spirochaetales bacterium]